MLLGPFSSFENTFPTWRERQPAQSPDINLIKPLWTDWNTNCELYQPTSGLDLANAPAADKGGKIPAASGGKTETRRAERQINTRGFSIRY